MSTTLSKPRSLEEIARVMVEYAQECVEGQFDGFAEGAARSMFLRGLREAAEGMRGRCKSECVELLHAAEMADGYDLRVADDIEAALEALEVE